MSAETPHKYDLHDSPPLVVEVSEAVLQTIPSLAADAIIVGVGLTPLAPPGTSTGTFIAR